MSCVQGRGGLLVYVYAKRVVSVDNIGPELCVGERKVFSLCECVLHEPLLDLSRV